MKRQYELKGSPIHCSLEVIFSIVRENTHLPTGDVGFSLSLPEIKKNVTLMSPMLAMLTVFTCSHLLMCQRITVCCLPNHQTIFGGMYFKVSLKFKQKVSNVVNSSDARYSI